MADQVVTAIDQLSLSGTAQTEPEDPSQETANPDFAIKHPLQNRWAWWYDYPGKKTTQNNWASHLKKIFTFDTVEDFWCLYNNITPSQAIQAGSNYHVFKDGIEPMWEDSANRIGGKWTVEFSSKKRADQLDQLWLFAVLAVVGEGFGEDSDQVTGVVVSVRKQNDRIALWTKDARAQDACIRIGEKFKEILNLPAHMTIGYQSHEDSMKRVGSSHGRPRYSV